MADYECYPLWGPQGNVDPFDLAITSKLATALLAWGEAYTATLNWSNPPASGFVDLPSAEEWLRWGAQLAAQLRDQGYPVEYVHGGQQPSELVAEKENSQG
jgi:hypothetical protein